jgi:hypothetical protein
MKNRYFQYGKYEMRSSDYELMLSDQDGGCAICGEKPSKDQRLHIDHDHSTGDVRGLLCMKHNVLLGLASDNTDILESAIKYLKEGGHPSRFYIETAKLITCR